MWTERQTVTGSRGTVVVLATLILLAALLAVPPAGAQVEPGSVELERIDGGGQDPGDVRAVAIRTCQTALAAEGTAARVLIARDDAFADALAAAPLAGDDGCILFTGPGEQPLDARVRNEIDRVRSPGGEVILLGGTEAVGQVVEDELTDAGYPVQRLAGTTRYETAVDIAEAVRQANPSTQFTEVILAYGENWPDSVTAGAYAAAQGVPIILTPTDVLHPAADAFLHSGPEVDRTTVVGGTAVIAEQTAAAAPNPQRFAGDNRMGTATAIATALWPSAGMTGSDFVFVNLEAPDAWTLALAAAPLSAQRGAPQLGVTTNRVPAETDAYLADYGQSGETKVAVLMGDESYIDAAVGEAIAARMGGGATATPGATPFAYALRDLGVHYVDGSRVDQQLIDGPVRGRLTWSPDGSALAVTVADGSPDGPEAYDTAGDIVIAAPDGDHHVELNSTPGTQEFTQPVWSPDGERLAVISVTPGEAAVLFVREIGGQTAGSLYPLTQQEDGFAFLGSPQAWSPDGSRIALTLDGEVAIVDRRSGGLTRLGVQGVDPAFSPGGLALTYTLGTEAYVIELGNDPSAARARSIGPISGRQPVWLDDDRILLAGERTTDGVRAVWELHRDGAEPTVLADVTEGEIGADLASDGGDLGIVLGEQGAVVLDATSEFVFSTDQHVTDLRFQPQN